MSVSIVESKSFDFAIKVYKLYKVLTDEKKEYILSKQLLRAGTSIGANVAEAQRGQSKKDFTAKMCIALKEASETEYWLKLLTAVGVLNENDAQEELYSCIELIKILTSIVKTSGQ